MVGGAGGDFEVVFGGEVMKITYVEKKFKPKSLALIETANGIIDDYRKQGFDLTLRQLYYQMVARDLIENTQKSYKRMGQTINNARLAGLLDWDAIVDRTRHLRSNGHWGEPKGILESAAYSYLEDRWANQAYRPEVWIEKDALIGVISGICEEYDVPYFSCRGYVSQSSMWSAGHNRLRRHFQNDQLPVIIHLADHDPSGMDMTRDNDERLAMFAGFDGAHDIERIALNMNQIERYNPPPNPAKVTDSRAKAYIAEFGSDSWELDALEPKVIVGLIKAQLERIIDPDAWKKTDDRILEHRETLEKIAENYYDIKNYLDD